MAKSRRIWYQRAHGPDFRARGHDRGTRAEGWRDDPASIGHSDRLQRVLDNDAEYVSPLDMPAELRGDNIGLAASMRAMHGVRDEHGDAATASLLKVRIDEAEKRAWFLFEATHKGNEPGR